MSESARPSRRQIARQAKQHLESLRAGGVEWFPRPAPSSSLFADFTAPEEAPAAALELSPAGGMSLEERRQALHVLAEQVSTCTRCPQLAATRTQTVFGVGEPGVELCFVGEAPGADED